MAFDLDDEENEATRIENGASKESRDKNMDIEVGEYVRVNKDFRIIALGIGKVVGISKDSIYVKINFELPFSFKKENIKKRSKQLIDLVEVGDVLEIRTGLHSSFKYFVENEDNLLLLKEKVKEFWNIETILTKEQFEANCYKVGGK